MTEHQQTEYEKNLDTFTESYMRTALWSSVTDDGDEENPITDEHDKDDIDPETFEYMKKCCRTFFKIGGHNEIEKGEAKIPGDSEDKWDVAGHDFWLTQNGHGAGFWDGDWTNGEKLTEIADKFNGNDLYVGDDNKIHGSNPEIKELTNSQKSQSRRKPRM